MKELDHDTSWNIVMLHSNRFKLNMSQITCQLGFQFRNYSVTPNNNICPKFREQNGTGTTLPIFCLSDYVTDGEH